MYSVSRDFAKSPPDPMLVLPDDVVAHPLQVSIDIASLAPNAEMTCFLEGAGGAEARTINRARTFLKRHQTRAKSMLGDQPVIRVQRRRKGARARRQAASVTPSD